MVVGHLFVVFLHLFVVISCLFVVVLPVFVDILQNFVVILSLAVVVGDSFSDTVRVKPTLYDTLLNFVAKFSFPLH